MLKANRAPVTPGVHSDRKRMCWIDGSWLLYTSQTPPLYVSVWDVDPNKDRWSSQAMQKVKGGVFFS